MKSHNYCPEFYVTEISMISQPKEVFSHGGKAPADHRPRIQTRPSFGRDVCLLSCPEAEIHRGQCLAHDWPQSRGWCQCQFSDRDWSLTTQQDGRHLDKSALTFSPKGTNIACYKNLHTR